MTSLIAILDLKGKPLIQRSYRDDVPSSYIERFLPLVLEIEEEGQQVTPCFSNQGVNYMHIRHSNLYREYIPEKVTLLHDGRTPSSRLVEEEHQCSGDHFISSPPFSSLGRVL